MKDKCKVVVKYGTQFITMPDGTIIPNQIESTVIDKYDSYTIATVKLYVDLVESTIENGSYKVMPKEVY